MTAEVENVTAKVADLSLKKKFFPSEPKFEFIEERHALFEKLYKQQLEDQANMPRQPIKITFTKTGKVFEGTSWETTPMQVAKELGDIDLDSLVVAKVNGQVWDLGRPFEGDSEFGVLTFDDEEGRQVFWHSSAHILGEACECFYGAYLCSGPPTEDGFFYEMSIDGGDRAISVQEYKDVEGLVKKVVKDKQKFERLVVTKENLLEMFKYNKYKKTFIETKIPDGTSSTVYRCGSLIDLCRGPHVAHTGRVKNFRLLKNSASYFLGDAANDSLQRLYGVSFPEKKLMEAHLKFLEEAALRDHRKIGRDQELFFFNELSPGSAFWLPHGARIYNAMIEFLKQEYRKRGYEEVITPNMFNAKLWETSGHWANYKDNMFAFEVEKETFGLKPMNCPSHCLIFKNRDRSYRELPWRVADFGVLHRNEFSGALTGLTRVRRFQQDDAHIFCAHNQIEDEITGVFDFLKNVYGVLGFDFKMELSTRPDKYLGELETWNSAEEMLTNALNKWGAKWELNPGDGAFYGPKIDIKISDALRRWHQCATIQLDFQLPIRFDLNYQDKAKEGEADRYRRPVMIHRAIYGSLERMIGILCEHFFGKWPLWLSPRQVLVVPVGPHVSDYAQEVRDYFHEAGFFADADLGPNTLQKKVRQGQLAQYNYLFIVGEEEANTRSVNIRKRDGKQAKGETVPLEQALKTLQELKVSRALHE
ncbi:Threonine--tRNA ligase, cytoplasmic [Wickerhamiella sorbophila]|uniref:Threonine--tRNA ligase, cytoplasmic n=1 Tax=Wickerhamiella sorbophila TaxID=45607 RepID=A0A2T0FDH2_9ASCO|nr:Threonine--tRNA ligase, cytoplasmic [Wickerhamiella sorbophila]PRT52989.1 Threonine--tRNA ligase, cytoplasmic [Wickerhamiella sorbophila]